MPVQQQLLLSIPEAQSVLGGVGRTTIWELAKNGSITKVTIGRRAFITAESLNAYVGQLAARSQTPLRHEGPDHLQ